MPKLPPSHAHAGARRLQLLLVAAVASGACHDGPTNVPPPVVTPQSYTRVAAGSHTCALSTSGKAYCWGYNGHGELGNNDTSLTNAVPVEVAGGLAFQTLSVSKVEGVTCGLTADGAAYCWGQNANGELGDGTRIERHVPTRVASDVKFKDISVGNAHVCAISLNGAAYCWGTSPNGALGDGATNVHLSPSRAASGFFFTQIVTGSEYTCGLTPDGDALCWGLGAGGQLGNGLVIISPTPVLVSGELTFNHLAAAASAACAISIDGKAWCWGLNFFGTLGNGQSATIGGRTRELTPVPVSGALTFHELSAGYETMCGVIDGGVAKCWGYNANGGVGDGTFEHRPEPTTVTGGIAFQSTSSGTGYSCGLSTAGRVFCWGDNSNGSLGDGTSVTRTSPVPVQLP